MQIYISRRNCTITIENEPIVSGASVHSRPRDCSARVETPDPHLRPHVMKAVGSSAIA